MWSKLKSCGLILLLMIAAGVLLFVAVVVVPVMAVALAPREAPLPAAYHSLMTRRLQEVRTAANAFNFRRAADVNAWIHESQFRESITERSNALSRLEDGMSRIAAPPGASAIHEEILEVAWDCAVAGNDLEWYAEFRRSADLDKGLRGLERCRSDVTAMLTRLERVRPVAPATPRLQPGYVLLPTVTPSPVR